VRTALLFAAAWFALSVPVGVLVGIWLAYDPEEEAEAREEEAADRADARLRRHENPHNGEVSPWR
jgi:hypothetical protein